MPELPTPDVCAVCLTAPSTLGVLDSCAHVFCVPCVARWATIETKCPLCKARFTSATPTTVDEQGVKHQTGDVIKFEETNQGENARGDGDEDDDEFGDDYDDMASVMCEVCHRGDDEEFLMLCDGCDAGCHSFCVGLATVPRGQWYCGECRGSAVVREQAAARSRARDILLRVEGGTRAVRRRERVMDRERRMARARERGEIHVAGGGGERVATGNEARVRQISRVHELREAWSLLQSGQMEFPGWNRANTLATMTTTPDLPRVTVPSAPRARGEAAPEGDVVEEAWDVLEKAMKDQSTTASTSKRRSSGKDVVTSQSADASPPPRVLKRPAIRASSSGWSMSAAAWAPSMKAPRVTRPKSPEASPVIIKSVPKSKRELSNLPPKEIAKIAVSVAKNILKPKYANGQISREEFKAMAKQATQMSVDASTVDPEEIARIVHRLLD